jgi:uncharacterized membrane protein YgcG
MKQIKRKLALLLTVIMVLAQLPSAAFADGEGAGPTITLSDESAKQGESVSMSVDISDNPGLMVMMFTASYDSGRLELTGISAEGISGWDVSGDRMLWLGSNNNDFNGTILKLNFKILETAAAGTVPVTLVCIPGDMADHEENQYTPDIKAGSVTIIGTPIMGGGGTDSGSGSTDPGSSGGSGSGSGSGGSTGGSGSSGSAAGSETEATGTAIKPPLSQLTIDFEDVPRNAYYYTPVVWAFHHDPQITDGKSKTKFDPLGTCTRGEVVTFLWRAAGCPEPKSLKNQFTDVKETDYFFKPVLWAVEQGITEGTNAAKTHFSPWTTCSTAHIITFLYRSIYTGRDGWYTEAGDWANGFGMLSETGLLTDPNENCPRGAVVTFLYRWSQQQ